MLLAPCCYNGAAPYAQSLRLSCRWFDEYEQQDFARAGTVASTTVELPEGPLPMFQHTMEPMLRTKLGMPVKLTKGVVTLIEPFTLCNEGDELTPEQAQILALLKYKIDTFKPALHCKWWDEQFKMYSDDGL
jgi:mRNA turnover protein 4